MSLITFGAVSQTIDSNRNLRIKKVSKFDLLSEKSFLVREFQSFHNFNSLLWNDLELSSSNFDQYNSALFIPEISFGLMKDLANDIEIGFGWYYQIYNKDILSVTATDTNRLTKRITLRIILF
ncbi:MAG: hypothetical protein IH946_05225 [Bacteroidetes bacterium]|nr:hypothetical protein [Bacteroidota bacterium]